MQVQASIVRAQPVNQGPAMCYVGNPLLSQTITVDGQFDQIVFTSDTFPTWQYVRVCTDTTIYVKVGSAATAVPRYLVQAGGEILIKIEKQTDTLYAAAA